MMSDKPVENQDERQLHTDQLAGMAQARAVDDSESRHRTEIASQSAEQPLARKAADSPRADATPLFAGNDAEQFRERWGSIQSSFVDEPQRAVEQADALVAEVMQRLAQVFADERSQLENQWAGGGETDTEKLRVALRRYRSFFDRLLTM